MSSDPALLSPRERRGQRAVALLVLLGGFVLTVAASAATGPAFDEEKRIAAVRRGAELLRALSDFGPSALVSSSARAIYDELGPFGAWTGMASAWAAEIGARWGVDRVVTGRTGWLLWTGLAPFATFELARGRGVRPAVLAAMALLAQPRWVHAAAAAREPAVVASIWLVLLAAYARTISPGPAARRAGEPRPSRGAAVAFGVAMGLGVATTLATLWILPAIIVHHWLVRGRSAVRMLRRGIAPLPAALAWAALLGAPTLLATTPRLWRGGPAGIAEWLFAPLSPTIEPGLFGAGSVVTFRDVPASYPGAFLLATTPALVLALALAGAVVLALEARAVRRGTRGRDPRRLGALLLVLLAAVVLGPALTPRALVRFPPRVELALPCLAIAAALPIELLVERLGGGVRSTAAALVAAVALGGFGLTGVPTASAHFGLLAGRTRGAVESRRWQVGDGSEVSLLLPAIDARGAARVAIDAPDVPKGYFAAMTQVGRLRTRVEPLRSGGGLSLSRGARAGAIATVERDGATLWSLAPR